MKFDCIVLKFIKLLFYIFRISKKKVLILIKVKLFFYGKIRP